MKRYMENNNMAIAIVAALRAGHEIMRIYNDPLSDFEIERKADNSPLTIADKKAHHTILSYLEQTPYPVLSEEGKAIPYSVRKHWDTLWVVDPLDGTKEFIKRNGEFTVNIALVTNGIPVLGVIYVPVTNVMYVANPEIGALKLTELVFEEDADAALSYTSEELPLLSAQHKGMVVVASRSHLSVETEQYVEKLRELYSPVEFISSGSSIKICLVAEGTADVYPRFAPTMEWDTAAGHAIAIAAGLQIYQYDSNLPLAYNKEDLLNPWFSVEKVRTDKNSCS